MGEYAVRTRDNVEVKIGTCEQLFYLRYEDRHKVKYSGDLDQSGLYFRLPFPDEDGIKPGDYEDFGRGERLYKKRLDSNIFDDAVCGDFGIDPDANVGTIQLHYRSGLLMNVPCFHGSALPEAGPGGKNFWNGKTWHLELACLKSTEAGIMPVVKCRFCDCSWSVEFKDIQDFVHGKMKERLEDACARRDKGGQ